MKTKEYFNATSLLVLVLCIGAFSSGIVAQTIAEKGGETDDLSTLMSVVTASTEPLLEGDDRPAAELLADPELEVTVFAPTNDAIAAGLEALGMSAEEFLAKPDLVAKVLKYHIAKGKVMAADITDGMEIETLLGEPKLVIAIDPDGGVQINDGAATVTTPDVEADNGVVHIISGLLVPPTDDAAAEEGEEAKGDEATDEAAEDGGDEDGIVLPSEAEDGGDEAAEDGGDEAAMDGGDEAAEDAGDEAAEDGGDDAAEGEGDADAAEAEKEEGDEGR